MEVIGIGKVLLLVKFRLLYNISIKMIESVILNSVKIGYVYIFLLQYYEGDVSDFDLIFFCDEDCMGRLEIYEFVFGGKVMLVINENKLDFYYC